MQSNKSSDVTIVCEDKTRYKVHKFVLNACSPVFQSIIDNLPENEGSVVYLRGVFSQEMKSIIQFMYLGQATFYQNRMNVRMKTYHRFRKKQNMSNMII